jgi:hypothetical protein
VVPDVKPAFSPSRQTSWEIVWDIFSLHTLPQLKDGSTHLGIVLFTRLGFEMENITEEVEVGFYF